MNRSQVRAPGKHAGGAGAGHQDAFGAPAAVQAAVDFMAGKPFAATSAAMPAPMLIPPSAR